MRNILKTLLLYLLLGVCLAVLTGCSNNTPKPIDAGVKPFVNRFEALINKQITFSITLADIDQKWAGVCYIYSDGTREVQLSSYWWEQMGEDGKEETVFHELGHCELGRGHIPETNDSVPLSIMYPVAFGDQPYYADKRQYYIDELLSNKAYQYGVILAVNFDGDFQRK